MVLLMFLGVILLTAWLQYVWSRRKLRAINNLLPGPPSYPVVGSGLTMMGCSNSDILRYLRNLVKDYPTPCRIWLGPRLFVLLDHPDDVQIALNSPNANSKGVEYEFLNVYPDASGLITANGDMWKKHRKLLNPCFIPKILDAYLPIFNGCSKVLNEKVDQMCRENLMFDIEPLIHCCTFDQICETTMGVQLDIQNNVDHQMLISCDRFLNIVTNRFYKFWLHPNVIYQRTKAYAQQIKDVDYIRDFSCNVLNKIKNGYNTKVVSKGDEDERKPISFINQLLKISKETDAFNNTEVITETITAIMAGTETSATTMANTVLLLAMHPDIQEKVFKELHDVFPTQDCEITKEDLTKLVYLEMVLKESMRLLIVSPIYVRQVTGDVTLSNGVTLPPGSQIAVLADTLHRRKDLWGDDAESFNPDHFHSDVTRHPYSFLPFSGGPRMCIGYKYAYMSMKVVMASMLRRYKFNTELKLNELEWDVSITLKLINKHMVTAEKRDW